VLLLALETSRRMGSLALARGERVLEERLTEEQAHASDLLPRLEGLLAGLDVPPTRPLPLTAVVVGTGPGSYTGLRVGIATAQGLARATGARVFGRPSFEALAHGALHPGEEAAVVLDARAGRFYHARYRRTAGGLLELAPPAALTAAALLEALEAPGPILGHPGLAEAAGLPPAQRERLRTEAAPSARSLLELGRALAERSGPRAEGEALEAVEPLYLRAFGQA